MIRTKFCDLFGVRYPIMSAPMGPNVSGPELVAAVGNAGGFGLLQAQLLPPPLLREEIRRLRALTDKPFGVNFIPHFPHEDGIAVCIEERVAALSFYWGDPRPFVEPAHAAGVKVIHQAGSVEEAVYAARSGVDVVIAQGVEAGGHVRGEVSTIALVPRVVDAVSPVPVAAAGGISDARGFVAALALGAQAVVLGTRFLATNEANAHPLYKQKIVEASENETVRTTLYGFGWPDAPHRTLRTKFVEEWLPNESRGSESRSDEPQIGETKIGGQTIPVMRFMGFPPSSEATGDIESMDMLAGQGVGLVREIKPAGEVISEIVAEAGEIIRRLSNRGPA